MNPSIHDHEHEQYGGADGHPAAGSVPAPGLPNPNYIPRRATVQWSTGLCHCFDDLENCLITSCCPCITFGQIAEIVNHGSPSCVAAGAVYGLLILTGFPCFYSCKYRSKLRGQFDLEEAPCSDFLVHFCYPYCALCQEYRYLKRRGYDMGIGYQANVDRRNRGVTLAPAVRQGMSR